MKINERLKLEGNVMRIYEMKESGMSIEDITKVFKKNGFHNISNRDIETVITSIPLFINKVLPKKIVADYIKQEINHNNKN